MHPQPSSGALLRDVPAPTAFTPTDATRAAKALEWSADELAQEAMGWLAYEARGARQPVYANVFAAEAMRRRVLAARLRLSAEQRKVVA